VVERDARIRQGVDPSSLQLFVPVLQLWRWVLAIIYHGRGVVTVALIRTVLHNIATRVVVEGGSDVFPSLGVSGLAPMVELARE